MPLITGMYYFENGGNWARPAVILIHGAGGNNLSWPPEIRRLQDQRIYALDLPGHGKSEGIGRQSIPDYARCALWLGIHNPTRTLGLGLVATAPRLRVSPELISRSSVEATLPLAIKTTLDMSFGSNTDPRTKELTSQRMAEIRYPVLHGDFMACDAFDETSLLGRAKAPALIICGSEDKMTPVRYSQVLQRRLKKSLLHIIDGAGHMVMIEEPRAVAGYLNVFLNSITYQPGNVS
jgi:pimeloyl-ACP methyl ester carboxylesterase